MLCHSVDIGTAWQSCELFRAFADGPSVGTFCGRLHIQMDAHLNKRHCYNSEDLSQGCGYLNEFFCVPSGLT